MPNGFQFLLFGRWHWLRKDSIFYHQSKQKQPHSKVFSVWSGTSVLVFPWKSLRFNLIKTLLTSDHIRGSFQFSRMSFLCTKWPWGKMYSIVSHHICCHSTSVSVCFAFPLLGGVSVVSPGRPRRSPCPLPQIPYCSASDPLPHPETLLLSAELEQTIALPRGGQKSTRWVRQGPGFRFSGIYGGI